MAAQDVAELMAVAGMGLQGSNSPLLTLVATWQGAIRLGMDHKRKVFGRQAEECMNFYGQPHDFLYETGYGHKSESFRVGSDEGDMAAPTFRVTANKTFEFVSLFGPLLYHRNPVRRVRPRQPPAPPAALLGIPPGPPPPPPMPGQPPDPLAQQYAAFLQAQTARDAQKDVNAYRAALVEFYLNYTPNELKLKEEFRKAIDEALIKGRGCLYTQLYKPPGAEFTMVGTFFDSVDNLVIDPDAEDLLDAKWVAQRNCHPVWEVERQFHLKPGSLKGNGESTLAKQSTDIDPNGFLQRHRGETADLLTYYKVWTRMGIGGRLRSGAMNHLRPFLEGFGDYCYLVLAHGVPYPLNLPPEVTSQPNLVDPATGQLAYELLRRVAWPIPFWLDAPNPWPVTFIDFHQAPKSSWPMGHLTPAMGYQKAIDWLISMMTSKIRTTSRDFIVMAKSADDEHKAAIQRGDDLTILEVDKVPGQDDLTKLVNFLQHPPMNDDSMAMLELLMSQFEMATGMNETLYGQGGDRQMRSAQEAALRGDMVRLRPDDMANRVEDAAGEAARKEAVAARWALDPRTDIQPILGDEAARYWAQLVQTTDMAWVTRELEYRIEAGSAKKPNKDLDLANTNEAAQFVFPALMQAYQQTGDPTQVNAFFRDWCKARDLDAAAYMLPPIAPPPPPGQPAGNPPAAAPLPAGGATDGGGSGQGGPGS